MPRRGGVEIATTRGTESADHAIVTLPLGVLQSGTSRFAEPLDCKNQRAIERPRHPRLDA
ncbi:MAG: FAD-dependent oxidoreductase [Tabrizicola sp.]|nr:FAD-dependent oxidoreductase [Tabrizicola sp.]